MTGATQIVYFNQNDTSTNTSNNWALYVGYPIGYYSSPVPFASLTDVSVSPTGEIYASGYLSADYLGTNYRTHVVLSITSLGVISWSSEYSSGTNTSTYAQYIKLDSSSIYVAGYGVRAGRSTVLLSKYNTSGTRQWVTKVSQPQSPSPDQGNTIAYGLAINSSLGKIYIAGYSELTNLGPNYIKGQLYTYNTSGSLIDQSYFGANTLTANATSLVIDSSNNIWTSGRGNNTAAIAKFDSDLNLLGFKTLTVNTAFPGPFYTSGINKDSSGYFYLTGYGSDSSSSTAIYMFVAKYDSSINLVSSQKYSDSFPYQGGVSDIDSSNNIWIAARNYGASAAFEKVHVLKVDPSTLSILMGREIKIEAYNYSGDILNVDVYANSIKVQGTDYYVVIEVQVSGTSVPIQTFGLLLKLPTDGSLTSATPRNILIGNPAAIVAITYLSVSPTASSLAATQTTPAVSGSNYGFPTYTSSDVLSTTIPYNANKPFV